MSTAFSLPTLSSSYEDHIPSLERDLCSNFTCCGLYLADLHELMEHFEVSHRCGSASVSCAVLDEGTTGENYALPLLSSSWFPEEGEDCHSGGGWPNAIPTLDFLDLPPPCPPPPSPLSPSPLSPPRPLSPIELSRPPSFGPIISPTVPRIITHDLPWCGGGMEAGMEADGWYRYDSPSPSSCSSSSSSSCSPITPSSPPLCLPPSFFVSPSTPPTPPPPPPTPMSEEEVEVEAEPYPHHSIPLTLSILPPSPTSSDGMSGKTVSSGMSASSGPPPHHRTWRRRSQGHSLPRKREKMYRCPEMGCLKSYLNPNGLKYHVEKGKCKFDED